MSKLKINLSDFPRDNWILFVHYNSLHFYSGKYQICLDIEYDKIKFVEAKIAFDNIMIFSCGTRLPIDKQHFITHYRNYPNKIIDFVEINVLK